jgi:hypothetical protein
MGFARAQPILQVTTGYGPPPTLLLRLARKRNLEARVRQSNPTGKSLKSVSSPFEKNIPLNPSGKSVI